MLQLPRSAAANQFAVAAAINPQWQLHQSIRPAQSTSPSVKRQVWAIVTMIGSGFFFSFIIGRMGSVMSKLDSVRPARSERLESVTTFLKDVDLPRPLSKRWGVQSSNPIGLCPGSAPATNMPSTAR